MAEPTWTKGPYRFDPEHGRVYAGDGGPGNRVIVAFVAAGNSRREANGQLLAAAPVLYEALAAARKQVAFDLEGAAGAAATLSVPGYEDVARSLDQRREEAEGVLAEIDAALAGARESEGEQR